MSKTANLSLISSDKAQFLFALASILISISISITLPNLSLFPDAFLFVNPNTSKTKISKVAFNSAKSVSVIVSFLSCNTFIILTASNNCAIKIVVLKSSFIAS